MEKLIISAAICGAEVTKEQNPAVPYTVEEIAREAKSAYDAGASVIICMCAGTTVHLRRTRDVFRNVWMRFALCVPRRLFSPPPAAQ